MNLLHDYRNGKCEEVWKLISFLDYQQITAAERKVVNEIIAETFTRIEYNTEIIFRILDNHGFEYTTYGLEPLFGQRFVIGDKENWIQKADFYYSDKSMPVKIPWVMAAFLTWFKYIDFRGEFTKINNDLLLDPLVMESFDDLQVFHDLSGYPEEEEDEEVGFMFAADAYHKQNISGDAGPQILMSKKILVDNYVIGYTEEFELTFMDYLRFNYQWACFPGLAWAEEDEKAPFQSIIREVANKIQPF